jgi:uncharacterized protein DUF4405
MTRRTKSLLLDGLALVSFGSLTSWRFTGIVAHEWLALLLFGVLVLHLLIHADWIEARVRALRQDGGRRTSAAAWLNASLFLAMGTTMISGFVISKVLVPNSLAPGAYLNWHSLHERATMATLVILALHLALNWDLVMSGLGRRTSARAAVPPAAEPLKGRLIALHPRRLVWLIGGPLLLSGAVVGVEALVPPATSVFVYTPDGKVEPREPPPELTAIQPGSETPSPMRGGPKILAQMVLFGLVVVGGRKILRLRLT